MEPIPETRRAFIDLVRYEEFDLEPHIRGWIDAVLAVVPDLVGVSFTMIAEGLTFTYEAVPEVAAALDAVQYLDAGPCVETVHDGQARETVMSALDEDRWRLFAEAGAAVGVRSTLSLPIADDTGSVVASINLYGLRADSFRGQADRLAAALGSWPQGVTHNADLAFQSRQQAQVTPERLAEREIIERAVWMISGRYDISIEQAQARLADASERAGTTSAVFAALLTDLADPPGL
ncbi:hypothetical protein DFJ68_2314 [Terracoccus luteus]|uniref:ANTAR domain-containing protein n=1 Tax=Terracoccus luteus TaxID=53356 RepID=A0A495XWB3_9MICO|nr:ANTAR domain-containing protein [Terracoccus luteus]RKT78860.1 hypothetical protein DFJ68_2314 [Terracoccus luteus]